MYKDIGATVVGTGFIGPVHVEALKRLGVNVIGICDNDENKRAAAVESMGLSKGYSSYDEVLEDKNVDVVHLAVPNIMHYEMAKRALNAGKHVLCEEPLAMNSEQSKELASMGVKGERTSPLDRKSGGFRDPYKSHFLSKNHAWIRAEHHNEFKGIRGAACRPSSAHV